MVEQTIEFQTSRGGDAVQLTLAEAREATLLANQQLRGGSAVFFGRSEKVRRAGEFLVAEAERRQAVSVQTPEIRARTIASMSPESRAKLAKELDIGSFGTGIAITGKEAIAQRQRDIASGIVPGFETSRPTALGKEIIPGVPISPAPQQQLAPSPLLTVEAVKERPGIPGTISRIKTFIREKETRGVRGDITFPERVGLFATKLSLPILQFPGRVFSLGKGLATEPIRTIKGIPSGFIASGKQIGLELKSPTPETALGTLGGEFIILKGTGKAISGLGKSAELASARFSTKFAPISKVKGGTGTGIKGVKTFLDQPVEFSVEGLRSSFKFIDDIPIRSQFDIPFAPSPISKAAESVPLQLERVGKKVRVVTAQTDFPFGQELERLLFFDPKGRLRTSRLGIGAQKEAGLLDILSGEVTFRKGRPQALFGEFDIATPPSDILAKLTSGKALTEAELVRFGKFVETPTGKLKPVPQFRERGFGAVEPEVAFGAGEIPFKKGKRAITIIDKRKVEVIEVGVKQSGKETQRALENIKKSLGREELGGIKTKAIDSFKPDTIKGAKDLEGFKTKGLGGLSQKEIQASLKTISKETGFSVKELSSQFFSPKPFVSLPKLIGSSAFSLSGLISKRGVSGKKSFPARSKSLKTPRSSLGLGFSPFKALPVKSPFTSPSLISPPRLPPKIPPPGIPIPQLDEIFETPFPPKKPPIRRLSDEAKRKKKKRKLRGREQLIRPSFTGIITAKGFGITPAREFERAAKVTKLGGLVDIGISPGALRGTRTGLVPNQRKSRRDFGFTDL